MSGFKNTNHRFLKFALVGVSGTMVDFGFFNLFSVLIGLPVILSSILSFSIAVFNNFYWNRVWTYPESKNASLADQLTKFGVVSVLGLFIRTPLFAFIEKPVIQIAQTFFSSILPIVDPVIIGHNLALAAVIIVVLFWNYFVNRIWTYKDFDIV